MDGNTSSTDKTPKPKQSKKASKTLEVPRSIQVRVNDGLIESLDKRASIGRLLFQHVHDSLNDKNDMGALKELASVHGLEVELGE